jgi:DNA-binding MarR family transcriptional regulator
MQQTISFLLANICKAHRQRANVLLSELGLHAGQEMLLMRLWEQDGRTQSEMSESMCVQAATLTTMLQRMESAGLMERRKDPDDQRVSRVFLTGAGKALKPSLDEVWQRLEGETLASLTLDERVLLRRLLLQVRDNLSADEAVALTSAA